MRLKVKVKGKRAIIYYKDGNVIRVVEPKEVYENVFGSDADARDDERHSR